MPGDVLGPPVDGRGVPQLSQRADAGGLRALVQVLACPVLLVDVDRVVLLDNLLCGRAQCHNCPDIVLILLDLKCKCGILSMMWVVLK